MADKAAVALPVLYDPLTLEPISMPLLLKQLDLDPCADVLVRPDVKHAIDQWGAGIDSRAGAFVTAVLQGDIICAIARADRINRLTIVAIVSYCLNCLPRESWGNHNSYNAWKKLTVHPFG